MNFIQACDSYLNARTGKYEWRRVRYLAALRAMERQGLAHSDTVFDIGAGWTEFDYCLRTDGRWRGRYVPIDGGIDGIDLDEWVPLRTAEYFVALELVEHLYDPERLIRVMQARATKGVILSTPNPMTTDVLGMDATHKTEIHQTFLRTLGFDVEATQFYGKPHDSLFAAWRA